MRHLASQESALMAALSQPINNSRINNERINMPWCLSSENRSVRRWIKLESKRAVATSCRDAETRTEGGGSGRGSHMGDQVRKSILYRHIFPVARLPVQQFSNVIMKVTNIASFLLPLSSARVVRGTPSLQRCSSRTALKIFFSECFSRFNWEGCN